MNSNNTTETPSSQPISTTHQFQFTGNGTEYFKIWIVNILLTILTVGIYSAWAKVRTQRYFYGNTVLDGASFEYHAKPITILKGRIIAIVALLAYVGLSQFYPLAGIGLAIILAIVSPWIIRRAVMFNAWMTSYRNVRFNFQGSTQDAYKYFFLIPLSPLFLALLIGLVLWLVMGSSSFAITGTLVVLAFMAMYFLYPWFQKMFTGYYINHHHYGQGVFKAELETDEYYIIYLLTIAMSFLIGIIVLIGFALLAALATAIGSLIGLDLQIQTEAGLSPSAGIALAGSGILAYLGFIAMATWLRAYLKTKLRNYVYSKVELDEKLKLESTMNTHRLAWIYFSNLLLLIITIGLAYPWAKARLARYSAQTTQAHVQGELDGYVTDQQKQQSALGEELGDAFDVDVGMGLSL